MSKPKEPETPELNTFSDWDGIEFQDGELEYEVVNGQIVCHFRKFNSSKSKNHSADEITITLTQREYEYFEHFVTMDAWYEDIKREFIKMGLIEG